MEHLIKIELLIVEDIVKYLVKESSVVKYLVIVERNSWSKIAKIK